MKFLLDANMPRSASVLLRELGHEVEDVRDVLPGNAEDKVVAEHAKLKQAILVTRDFDFADIRNYPPTDYPGIIVLELPDYATAVQVNSVLNTFIRQSTMLEHLKGRLAIVESWRVRFRPS